ncbi:uncharacterized protein PHACADRAFT_260944 [Phanerochaete carnosa HHB-10118-sp]|uniref:Uncharacterized protein n=1 Tax=Phanerochaete carnosa (strain HHB-10118-sp) TaxID=650164 RepID=K5URH9_PHACS|nr:uncharacterized protein PHACADRAFT_260944 [Phanerochaete carnosa HHB-10118-sp]EKM52496.1 hypothetical protein PHACADRAFT_260944 [Phanerochaete carnosa HHB-10118-sp]
MVNWESPEVVGVCLQITGKLNLYFGGIFTWYFITTFRHVEWQLLIRKLKWKWSYVYYLGARYFLLLQIPLHEVMQPVIIVVLAITAFVVAIFASGNLLFRV